MKHSLEEVKKMLSEISPWPWGCASSGGDGLYVFHSGHQDEEHDVCYSSDQEAEIADMQFISESPQIISDLVEECDLLKKQTDLFKQILEMIHAQNPGLISEKYLSLLGLEAQRR